MLNSLQITEEKKRVGENLVNFFPNKAVDGITGMGLIYGGTEKSGFSLSRL